MQHVSAAEFTFCLGNGCLRWNDFLWEQSKVRFRAFPPMGRGHPAWEREVDSLTTTISPKGLYFRVLARWPLKSNNKGSQGDNSNWRPPCHLSLAIRLAAPLPDHVQALQSIALPPGWVSVIPAVDTLLMICSWLQLQKIAGREHWSVWIRWDGVAGRETH